MNRRRALTLLELVVVLVILVVLTSVAVTSLDGVADQARFDATRKSLDDIRAAVVGPATSGDGEPTGFVADIGRLPASLDELLVRPATLVPYAIHPPIDSDGDGIADVTLASGWRGPYLRLPPGATSLRDGWGNPLTLAVGPPWTVTSLGADNVAGGTDINVDTSLAIAPSEYLVTGVTFRLYELTAAEKTDPTLEAGDVLSVTYYAVNPTTGEVQSLTAPVDASFQAQVTNLPMGTVAARAFHRSSANAIKKKSAVVYLRLGPRTGTAHQSLILK